MSGPHDCSIVLGTSFNLAGGNKMTPYEYMNCLSHTCSTDNRFVLFISVVPNRGDEMMRRLVKRGDLLGNTMAKLLGF